MSDTKLLPCPNPWCKVSRPHEVRALIYPPGKFYVACPCGVSCPACDTEAEAVALWNQRQPSVNQKLLEALKDADHLCKWLLQSDISDSDRERVIRDNGINFALAIDAAEAQQ